MARIRSIKPDFWTDGDVVGLSFPARLLFIGSWNFAMCDFGHVADDPVRLKMQVLPADDVDANDLLDELLEAGRMVRLVGSDGRTYLHIKRFVDHQKIERRWSPRCPACADDGVTEAPLSTNRPAEPRRTSRNLPETPRTSAQEGKGREGKGVKTSPPADAGDDFEAFWTHYPRKVKKAEAAKVWGRARKKADLDTIIGGLNRYLPVWRITEPQFIPHASAWLNGERWNDEVTAPHRESSATGEAAIWRQARGEA
jgi:hypothetical protein